MCNCIACKPTVNFRELSWNRTKFSPYFEIAIHVSEEHICPFCGKTIKSGQCMCNCGEFQAAFDKLVAQQCRDTIVPCVFGTSMKGLHNGWYYMPVHEIQSKLLKKSDIEKLGVDFWDFSKMYSVCGKCGFRFANPSFKDGILKFYWKNLKTKRVHLCTLQDFYTYEKVFLYEVVQKGDKVEYNQLIEFQNWNDCCSKLKEM